MAVADGANSEYQIFGDDNKTFWCNIRLFFDGWCTCNGSCKHKNNE